MQHLDMAGGTGDIAFAVMDRLRRADEQAAEDRPDRVTPAVGVPCTMLSCYQGIEGKTDCKCSMKLMSRRPAETNVRAMTVIGPAELMALHYQEVHHVTGHCNEQGPEDRPDMAKRSGARACCTGAVVADHCTALHAFSQQPARVHGAALSGSSQAFMGPPVGRNWKFTQRHLPAELCHSL